MSCLSWNCRALGNLRAVHVLQRLISNKDPTVVFLRETKSNVAHMERLMRKLNFDRSFTVASRGRSGGLYVLWKDEINLSLRTYSQNHIDMDVGGLGDVDYWCITFFYGFPAVHDRAKSWQLITRFFCVGMWINHGCVWVISMRFYKLMNKKGVIFEEHLKRRNSEI